MATYRTNAGDMLDEICWRYYGIQSGAVESVMAANRDLADFGPVYAAGVSIELPEISAPPASIAPVRLWD